MINKRLVILISIIFGILIVAIFALWLVFRSPAEEPVVIEESPEEEAITTPTTDLSEEEFSIFKLSNTAAVSPAIAGGKVLYLSKQNGNILETDFKGTATKTTSNIMVPNLLAAIWSPDKSQIINIYEGGGEIKKAFLDIASQKATSLDRGIKFINFSHTTNKIVYQFVDNRLEINKIATSEPTGLNWKNILNIRMNDVRVYWPQENTLAIATTPSGLVKGAAFIKKIDDQSSGLNKIIDNAYGLTIKYSPDGSRLLYSQTDQYGRTPSLYLQKNGGLSENLNLSTLSEKCVFSKTNNIYCAVPRVINGSLILPDDFYKNIAGFSDIFFKIDGASAKSSILFDPADFKYDFNADELQMSNNEDYLVFINKKDGLLYSIKIQ